MSVSDGHEQTCALHGSMIDFCVIHQTFNRIQTGTPGPTYFQVPPSLGLPGQRQKEQVVSGARLLKRWDPVPEGSFSSLRTLTNEAEQTLDLPKRRSRHGTSPWLSTEQLWVRSKMKRRGPL